MSDAGRWLRGAQKHSIEELNMQDTMLVHGLTADQPIRRRYHIELEKTGNEKYSEHPPHRRRCKRLYVVTSNSIRAT